MASAPSPSSCPSCSCSCIVLVIGLLVAKAIAKALNAVLERVGFDRAVERGGIKRAMANS